MSNNLTVSEPQNIQSPPGNSLAIFLDKNGVLQAKDVRGNVYPLSKYLPSSGGGTPTLPDVFLGGLSDTLPFSELLDNFNLTVEEGTIPVLFTTGAPSKGSQSTGKRYLWKLGAGEFNPIGGSDIESKLELIQETFLSRNDLVIILNDSNAEEVALGVISEDFISYMNSNGPYGFTDVNKTYIITFTKDDIDYAYIFQGTLGFYGAGNLQFVADDFIFIYKSENQGRVNDFDNQNYLNLITDFPLNVNIIEKDNKYIIPNLIEDEVADVQKWYYVKKSTGLDTNNGDLLTPFKTLKKALLEVRNNNTFSNYGIEILEDCVFYSQDLQGEVNFYNKKLTITTEFNCIITSGLSGQTWSLTSGKTNTYQTTALVNLCGVIDIRTSNYDNNGIPKPLLKVASIDLVESTPNSFFLSADLKTAYVHTFDNSIPNDDVLAVRSNYDFRFAHGSLSSVSTSLILNNLKFFGAQIFLSAKYPTQTSIDTFIAKDCIFSHGLMTNLLNIVNYDNSILQSCISSYSLRDLNNYSPTNITDSQKNNTVIIELNCKYNDSGIYAEPTVINNLSTAHLGINVLRINCIGYNSKGPAIADVNGCRTINILVNVFDRNNTPYSGFSSNNEVAHRQGFLTLIDCFSDYNLPINSTVYTELYKTKILKNSTLTNFKLLN